MSYQKIAKMVDLLAKGTRENSVDWEKTDSANEFQASFSDRSVRIARNDAPYGSEDEYVVRVYDWLGDVIEEVSDSDLTEVMRQPFQTMKEMFETARRKVMGVEDALDDIIRQLDDSMPF